MLDLREDELRDFLFNRIAELKMATTYGKNKEREEINRPSYKYKASTISNVLPHDLALKLKTSDKLHHAYRTRFQQT